MKTMPILIAMLLVGNAFGCDYVESTREIIARRKPQMPDVVAEAKKSSAAQTPYVPTPDAPPRPSSTSYSIITLPDGRTTSVLTYH
jgi:hypothetical protein